jgi:hypothetical protein
MSKAWRICNTRGCPEATTEGKCLKHRRAADKARGSREARGYDHAHREFRKAFIADHQAGTLICWRCRELIPANEPFHLGHDDNDRNLYRGAEHVRCNTATSGRTNN